VTLMGAGQLTKLAGDLAEAAVSATAAAKPVVSKGALNVKKTARQLAPSGPHTPAYRYSITYDTFVRGGQVVAEIGPDKDRNQGPLGNIFEYGTSEHPPQPHMGPALEQEADPFERFLSAALEKATL